MLLQGISVSPLKLQKVLYYQQAWHMVFFNEENTLFSDVPQAWVNGPVYPTIYKKYKEAVPGMCDHLNFSHLDTNDTDAPTEAKSLASRMNLTQDEIDLTQNVIQLYGAKSQNQLVFLTHCEKPWSEKRKGLRPYDYSDSEISLHTMYTYYSDRYKKNRE